MQNLSKEILYYILSSLSSLDYIHLFLKMQSHNFDLFGKSKKMSKI